VIELTNSSNELTRLAACKELMDRMVGRSTTIVESTHAKVDICAMYLAALRRANQPTHTTTIEGAITDEKPNKSGD
jgi:hypothetical protein